MSTMPKEFFLHLQYAQVLPFKRKYCTSQYRCIIQFKYVSYDYIYYLKSCVLLRNLQNVPFDFKTYLEFWSSRDIRCLYFIILNEIYFQCETSTSIQGHDHVSFAAFPSPPHRESCPFPSSTKHGKYIYAVLRKKGEGKEMAKNVSPLKICLCRYKQYYLNA